MLGFLENGFQSPLVFVIHDVIISDCDTIFKGLYDKSILSQNGSQVGVDYWIENWLMEMLDSSGNVLSSAEEKGLGALIDNVPQAVRGDLPQIPDARWVMTMMCSIWILIPPS
jgi:hypothetical protein